MRAFSIIKCPYCARDAELVGGEVLYPHRRDLYKRKFFYCQRCNASVGINKVTGLPLGTLADSNLRKKRNNAHNVFDVLWKRKYITRSQAYRVLSEKLGIPPEKCHIGLFNEELCEEVIRVALELYKDLSICTDI